MSIVKLSNNGVKNATAFGSITGLGNLIFISRSTASSSASVNITSGLTSTYKEYIFIFNNIHPATDGAKFQFNLSVDSGSNYNVTKTTSFFHSFHTEDDSSTVLAYRGAADLAQSTSDQVLFWEVDNDADSTASGYLHLFEPSSTTFVKHFIAKSSGVANSATAGNQYIAGYGNTTSAVNAVQFQMSSGNIDAGTIKLYGIKDS